MNRLEKVVISALVVITGWGSFLILDSGIFGSRGIKKVDEYTVNNRPAIVYQQNIRFGPDRYFIMVGENVRVDEGEIVTDDGKILGVNNTNITPWGRFYVRDAK